MTEHELTPELARELFGPRRPDEEAVESQSEQTSEEVPPKDKPLSEYTDEDWLAVHAQAEERLRGQQEEKERPTIKERTLAHLHAQLGYDSPYEQQKAERNRRLVEQLHPEVGGGGEE